MTLSREDTQSAYARHRARHEARDWTGLADLFAPEGRYTEPFFGELQGRAAIRDFLSKSMEGLDDWEFPLQWTLVGEGRVVTEWLNRLPGRRPDGSRLEFRGRTHLVYDERGEITLQDDSYDRLEAVRVLAEGRSPLVARFNSAILRAGDPVFRLAKRLTGM